MTARAERNGGRTARPPCGRLTPEQRAALDALLAKRKISFGMWIAEQVEKQQQEK